MAYDREKAVAYAHKWAFGRNPRYANFVGMGGDCTNFVSQCLYAGCGVMNFTPDFGWYYLSLNNRSAAWSGVEYLHTFLTTNAGIGPYGSDAPFYAAQPGDIVQLSFDGFVYSHTLLIVEVEEPLSADGVLIAAHSYDADYRPLSSYSYQTSRLIRIDGARGRPAEQN